MTYVEMIAAGLCTSCGEKSDSNICQPCRDKRNERRREAYQYKKRIGQCKWCSNKAEPHRELCYECLGKARDNYHASERKKSNETKMRIYYERKANGICTKCGKKPKEKGQLCKRCYCKVRVDKYDGIDRSERPSYGLCYICGEPKMANQNVCESCYKIRLQTIPGMLAATNNEYFRQTNSLYFKSRKGNVR